MKNSPDRQIRSLVPIVRPLACGSSVLLTSQNLVLSVRLVSCTAAVVLSFSVKNSVNDRLQRSRAGLAPGGRLARPARRRGLLSEPRGILRRC